jgi:hypothetical protein
VGGAESILVQFGVTWAVAMSGGMIAVLRQQAKMGEQIKTLLRNSTRKRGDFEEGKNGETKEP